MTYHWPKPSSVNSYNCVSELSLCFSKCTLSQRHWKTHLIYVPLTALNASADPTAIECSNHVPMNQSYTVSTEAVCPSRKSTVRSSPCTNIDNMRMCTSAKVPSKAMKTIKHPRKLLKIAHFNIYSLRNMVHEVNNLLVTDVIHILTISETLLDNTLDDTVGAIHGRKYRNTNGGVLRSILRTTFL